MGRRCTTNAFTPAQLREIDWAANDQSENHPVKVRTEPFAVYDLATGQAVATAAPGYRFYWCHGHIHIAQEQWNHHAEEAAQQAPPLKQNAEQLGDLGDGKTLFGFLAAIATAKAS